ncbi:hypothetical protein KEM56_004221, partial [Ascosphaera pollenicola]
KPNSNTNTNTTANTAAARRSYYARTDDVEQVKAQLASEWGVADNDNASPSPSSSSSSTSSSSPPPSIRTTVQNPNPNCTPGHGHDAKHAARAGAAGIQTHPRPDDASASAAAGNAANAAANPNVNINSSSVKTDNGKASSEDNTSTTFNTWIRNEEGRQGMKMRKGSASGSGSVNANANANAGNGPRVMRLTSKNLQSNAAPAGVSLHGAAGVPTGTADPRIKSWMHSVANNQDDDNIEETGAGTEQRRDQHAAQPAQPDLAGNAAAPAPTTSPSKAASSMAAGGISQFGGSSRSNAGNSTSKPVRGASSKNDPIRISSLGSDVREARGGKSTTTGPRKDDQKAAYDALVAEAQRKGEKPDIRTILRTLQEREQKKIGEKQAERKENPRHVDSANLRKARTGMGVKKGSPVVKMIERCRVERELEALPSVEEIRARYAHKLAEPMELENQVPLDGEIYDWCGRRWSLHESEMTHVMFREWLRSVSALEERGVVAPWDERFLDGKYQIMSMNWCEPNRGLEE